MASTNSTEYANYVAVPRVNNAPGKWYGKLRVFEANVTLASQADGDTVNLFILPKGFMPCFGMLHSPTLGSSTIAIGVSGTAGKYRAAATHTAVIPTLFGVVTSMAGTPLTADETIILTNTTAALPASGTLTVRMFGTGQE